jgi:hypothetical protein
MVKVKFKLVPCLNIPLRIWVHGCSFPPKIHPRDPLKDRHRFLSIDEFVVEREGESESFTHFEETKGISIIIKKCHIDEYPFHYCNQCLLEGKRVEAPHQSKEQNWCLDHYARWMRQEFPDSRCPVCEDGYISRGMGRSYCTVCDYDEPEWISNETSKLGFYCCDTANPETQTDHNERRTKFTQWKDGIVDLLKKGDYVPEFTIATLTHVVIMPFTSKVIDS